MTYLRWASRCLCPALCLWAVPGGLRCELTGPLIRWYATTRAAAEMFVVLTQRERAQAVAGRVAVLTQRNRSPVAGPLVC